MLVLSAEEVDRANRMADEKLQQRAKKTLTAAELRAKIESKRRELRQLHIDADGYRAELVDWGKYRETADACIRILRAENKSLEHSANSARIILANAAMRAAAANNLSSAESANNIGPLRGIPSAASLGAGINAGSMMMRMNPNLGQQRHHAGARDASSSRTGIYGSGAVRGGGAGGSTSGSRDLSGSRTGVYGSGAVRGATGSGSNTSASLGSMGHIPGAAGSQFPHHTGSSHASLRVRTAGGAGAGGGAPGSGMPHAKSRRGSLDTSHHPFGMPSGPQQHVQETIPETASQSSGSASLSSDRQNTATPPIFVGDEPLDEGQEDSLTVSEEPTSDLNIPIFCIEEDV